MNGGAADMLIFCPCPHEQAVEQQNVTSSWFQYEIRGIGVSG
jgi:hypothetical protein